VIFELFIDCSFIGQVLRIDMINQSLLHVNITGDRRFGLEKHQEFICIYFLNFFVDDDESTSFNIYNLFHIYVVTNRASSKFGLFVISPA